MKLRFVGDVAGSEGVLTATVIYTSDYRDETGAVPPPAYRFRRVGGVWQDMDGNPAEVLGPAVDGAPVPTVRVTYTLGGRLPFARTVMRRVQPNTKPAGYWDWTLPDAQQPQWGGGNGEPTLLEVLPGQGPKGERGAGWLFGRGAPEPTLGQVGDLYLDQQSFDVWLRGSVGWALTGNLQGARGAAGPKGERGKAGESWPAPLETDVGGVLRATEAGAADWQRLALADLSDVSAVSPADGQVLAWRQATGKYAPASPSAGIALSDLSDVSAAKPVNGQLLCYSAEDEKYAPVSVNIPLALPLAFPPEGVVVSGLGDMILEAVQGPYDELETDLGGGTWVSWGGPFPQPMPNMLRVRRSDTGNTLTTLILRAKAPTP